MEGILTVRENLMFSAALRLPRHVTRKEREDKVETIIFKFGLIGCADTVVSTSEYRVEVVTLSYQQPCYLS